MRPEEAAGRKAGRAFGDMASLTWTKNGQTSQTTEVT
jgi:hypothetical protein